ncbi:hypothetical protein V6N13_001020 [Hibiscus sabdariffa]|uniref:Uncharacterized protein n=1 Tax=Hibiscus sabdariffa TaxID=183260 RepID=A0ABR2G847_9ROSI
MLDLDWDIVARHIPLIVNGVADALTKLIRGTSIEEVLFLESSIESATTMLEGLRGVIDNSRPRSNPSATTFFNNVHWGTSRKPENSENTSTLRAASNTRDDAKMIQDSNQAGCTIESRLAVIVDVVPGPMSEEGAIVSHHGDVVVVAAFVSDEQ